MAELAPDTKIDRYIIETPLGAGGFGTVYRARHAMIGHTVALKVLLPQHTTSQVLTERLLREAQAVASIGNPHIVKVLDCGTSPQGEMFMVMELLQGKPLDAVIEKEAPFSIDRAVAITLQVLDGLDAAHEEAIIHRDIKPANLFLVEHPDVGGEDFVKVLDFGISKAKTAEGAALTAAGEILGTPAFMAPEQILGGAAGVDLRADLYSAAAVLYNMLAGEPPVESGNITDLIRSLLHQPPPSLQGRRTEVPAELDEIVQRGLAREPDERWSTAREFSAALRSFAPHLPDVMAPPTQSGLHAMNVFAQPAVDDLDATLDDDTAPPPTQPPPPPDDRPMATPSPATGPAPGQGPTPAADPSSGGFAPAQPTGGADPSSGGFAPAPADPSSGGFAPAQPTGSPDVSAAGFAPAQSPPASGAWPEAQLNTGQQPPRGLITTGQAANTPSMGGAVTPYQSGSMNAGERKKPVLMYVLMGGIALLLVGLIATGIVVAVVLSQREPATTPRTDPVTNNTNTAPRPLPPNAVRPGQPTTGTLPLGQSLDYVLRVERRSQVTITLESREFDTFLFVLRNGSEIGRDDDGGSQLNSRLVLFLEPADYTLRVSSYQNIAGGSFTLTTFVQ